MALNLTAIVKQRDTDPPVRAKVESQQTGNPIDLTGATVRFYMYDTNGVEMVNEAASIESPSTDGIVRYDWATGDTDADGSFDAEFEIILGSGRRLTAPNKGYIEVRIDSDLANA